MLEKHGTLAEVLAHELGKTTRQFAKFPQVSIDFATGAAYAAQRAAHVSMVYQFERGWHGKYEEHPVEFYGWSVSVWAGRNTRQGVTVTDPADVMPTIERLLAECDAMCSHERQVEVSQVEARAAGLSPWGMFCHVYKCLSCGRLEMVDSSG